MNATTYEPLRGVGKGVIGASVIRNTPTGMKLTPSPWKFPYDTDFSGEHLGRLNDLVDVEALFYRTMNPIKQELMQRENKIPYTKESLRNAAIGAIEKRNEAVSQPIDQQFLDDYANYVNELNKPHEYRSGGLVSDNPDVMMMEVEDQKFVGGGIAKAAKTAAKSAVATRELEKQAVLRAEAAAKSAAKQALMPQYNEAVKGQTQKQNPPSFEQWKAAKEAEKIQSDVLPAAERDANLAKMLVESKVKNRLYHGTTKDVKKFDQGQAGKKTGNLTTALGTFLSDSPKEASRYATDWGAEGGNVMPVFAQIKNPYEMPYREFNNLAMGAWNRRMNDPDYDPNSVVKVGDMEAQRRAAEAINKHEADALQDVINRRNELMSEGYDSVIVKIGGNNEVIVFDPRKIKSAIGNRGTYDINEADITKASGGAVYNTDPDMSDGGRIIEGAPFKRGGNVSLDAMYMAVNDAKFRRK
jgi:hypothetical protein